MVHHFIRTKSVEMNLPYHPELAPGAMERLMTYDWPGNVRELQNAVERALILSKGLPLRFHEEKISEKNGSFLTVDYSEKILTMDEMIASHIRAAIKKTDGKISGPGGAAELLAMHPNTLRSRMIKLGLAKLRN